VNVRVVASWWCRMGYYRRAGQKMAPELVPGIIPRHASTVRPLSMNNFWKPFPGAFATPESEEAVGNGASLSRRLINENFTEPSEVLGTYPEHNKCKFNGTMEPSFDGGTVGRSKSPWGPRNLSPENRWRWLS